MKFLANVTHIFDISKYLNDFFGIFMMINDRINKIIERENLTIASFARKINVGDQTVRSVCVMKRNNPSYDFIAKVVQTFEWLNPKWLLTGEGEMEIANVVSRSRVASNGVNSSGIAELVNYMREKDENFDRNIREKDRRIEQLIAESTAWRVRFEAK